MWVQMSIDPPVNGAQTNGLWLIKLEIDRLDKKVGSQGNWNSQPTAIPTFPLPSFNLPPIYPYTLVTTTIFRIK